MLDLEDATTCYRSGGTNGDGCDWMVILLMLIREHHLRGETGAVIRLRSPVGGSGEQGDLVSSGCSRFGGALALVSGHPVVTIGELVMAIGCCRW